ncbi:MAG: diacylglycerol kinase [Weeksellaceae bacterium]|nr:diacylglycerol kinase [Weeksellaceae bacterium]
MIVRFLKSSMYALEGLWFALKTERNVQIWFSIFIITYLTAFWLEVSGTEFLFVIVWTFVIGVAEYLNTAIEKLADRVSLEREEQIKRVKDVAAGATFLASTGAFITGLIIFLPKILAKFGISF